VGVNLYTDQLGNSALPAKLSRAKTVFRVKSAVVAALLLITALGAAFWMLSRSQEKLMNAAAVTPYKSIAVLPFENLSADPENAFFTNGVQGEILTDLAKVADLKVISRTSVMQYKSGVERNVREIAKALGVAHVLEGSVQRTGNRVRISAQLIDARSDTHLWAERYDRDLADVFAIQSEIAKTIADQLQAKISPSEKAAIEKALTTDLAAYDLYLRAQLLFADSSDPIHAREKLPQAAQLLEEAVTLDPRFFQAWCLLSRVHAAAYFRGHDHTTARLDLANAAVQTALRLQPDAAKPTSLWPFITTRVSATLDAPAASWLSPNAHCLITPTSSDTRA
jgi:TolB-like protein